MAVLSRVSVQLTLPFWWIGRRVTVLLLLIWTHRVLVHSILALTSVCSDCVHIARSFACRALWMYGANGFGRSLMKIMNSVGDCTLPCETPSGMVTFFLPPPPSLILARLLLRRFIFHFNILPPTPFSISFSISPSFYTLYNAFVRLKKEFRIILKSIF